MCHQYAYGLYVMLRFGAHATVVCRACRVESRGGRTAYAHPGQNTSQNRRSRSSFIRPAQAPRRAFNTPRLRRARGGWRCAATDTGHAVAEPEAAVVVVGEAKRTLFRVLASLDRGTAASETDVSVPSTPPPSPRSSISGDLSGDQGLGAGGSHSARTWRSCRRRSKSTPTLRPILCSPIGAAAGSGVSVGSGRWGADEVRQAPPRALSLWAKQESAEDAAMPIDERLNGKWRLVYSSTFAGKGGGTQGFTGAPTGGGNLRCGQVYQRVQARRKIVDNIVEFSTPDMWPLPSVNATATLSHGCAPPSWNSAEQAGAAIRACSPVAAHSEA